MRGLQRNTNVYVQTTGYKMDLCIYIELFRLM